MDPAAFGTSLHVIVRLARGVTSSQTFVLGTQSPKKYYVHNDIFRYQDMLQSDEETDTPPEKEDHQEIEPQEVPYLKSFRVLYK